MADALDLGSSGVNRGGSSPFIRIKGLSNLLKPDFFTCSQKCSHYLTTFSFVEIELSISSAALSSMSVRTC